LLRVYNERIEVIDMNRMSHYIEGAAKHQPLRFFAVFSAVAWNFKAKFYRHI